MTQPFTASEMRDAALRLTGIAEHLRETMNDARRAYDTRKAAQMLRQAADAMEERELWDATLRGPEFNAAKSAAIQAEFAAMQDKGEG